ncbi:hypothetical protein ALC57_02601 [Trachymyrmex cornetzi]|uniref:Uncharacterized protein n=1 Tax=Trachymyrmex cornetzi TaxID=471704 RepID=A0A151JNG0_9HYME|nr:hypothetical protein ALC57_02601 [Trachymyrmex cornetzi]
MLREKKSLPRLSRKEILQMRHFVANKCTFLMKRFHKKFCNETAKKICQKYKLDSCHKSILVNIFYSLRDETSREYSKLYRRKRVRSFVHHFLAFSSRHIRHACHTRVRNRMDDRSRCCSVKQQQGRDRLSTDSFTSVLLESKPHQNHHPYFSTSPGLS